MKKVNVILGILLLALLIVGAYYFWGTNLKADVSAAREENGVRCDVVLSNVCGTGIDVVATKSAV